MKVNYIGIVTGIVAFISLVLPWWTMSASAGFEGITMSADVSIYPHQATASAMGMSATVAMDLWFGQAALALIIIAGIAAIVGSLIIGKTGKMVLIVAGILALLSIIIFAAGLQVELSKAPPVSFFPEVGLFSSGSWGYFGASFEYSTYLSFGFWLALIAAIIAFISLSKHPTAAPTVPPTPEPETA